MKLVDRISMALSYAAAAMLFLTGVFLTYEVVARFIFRAPTTWAAEVSEDLLLWGVFLALGRTVLMRENITIEVLYEKLEPGRQRLMEIGALVFVLAFFAIVAKYGFDIALESFVKGSTTGTMVDVPKWWEEAAIPVGCGWAAVQTLVEIYKAVSGRGWQALAHHGKDI